MREAANYESESKFVAIIPKLAIKTSWIFSKISYVLYYVCNMLQYEQYCLEILLHECVLLEYFNTRIVSTLNALLGNIDIFLIPHSVL